MENKNLFQLILETAAANPALKEKILSFTAADAAEILNRLKSALQTDAEELKDELLEEIAGGKPKVVLPGNDSSC